MHSGIELEFGNVGFWGEGKTGVPVENLSEQGREPTTNSTHIWRRVWHSNLGHIGGRRALSPLHHPCSPENTASKKLYLLLLYSRRFSRYSAPIHWLVHGHMTSNNETVSRQMPWGGNIAKTMTSNGKQFPVTREMLTAVARDRWNLCAVFKFCFCFVLLYNNLHYCMSIPVNGQDETNPTLWLASQAGTMALSWPLETIYCAPQEMSPKRINQACSVTMA